MTMVDPPTVSDEPPTSTASPHLPEKPQPTTVQYNNWHEVDVPSVEAFKPRLPISVVVPYFEVPEKLLLALAGLETQAYPRQLFEVVIVDDGSRPPLKQPCSPLDVRVVHQEDQGFGLARARNNGARASNHDILVFLDCDMIPEADFLAGHARWHQVLSDAVTLGFYARVSADGIDADLVRGRSDSMASLLAGRGFDSPWIERHMARTGDFTSKHDDIFRAASGGNLGIHRDFFFAVGAYDESFTRYGLEDTEFVYRAYTQGGLLVPVREAFAWHQDRWHEDNENREHKQNEHAAQRGKVSNLIAHPGFRKPSLGRIFDVPQYVVTIRVHDESPHEVVRAAEGVLADLVSDLFLRIEFSGTNHDSDIAVLEDQLGSDPRIQIAPSRNALDGFPASPFHISLQPTAIPKGGLVDPLLAKLGTGVTAVCTLRDGSLASITRAWALHRSLRTGKKPTDFGKVVTGKLEPWHRLIWKAVRGATPSKYRQRRTFVPARVHRVFSEARHVRGPRTALMFLKWVLRGIGQTWRNRRPPDAQSTSRRPGEVADALGVEIVTIGKRAEAVFELAPEVAHRFYGQHVDILLADDADVAERMAHTERVPVVLLDANPKLSIPAFDARSNNPKGWVRHVERRVAVLGPPHHLPRGARVRRPVVARSQDTNVLRHCHHLEDVAAYHVSVTARAGVLARVAATGLPVLVADHSPELKVLLGEELYGLMATRFTTGDPDEREFRSIQTRRIALRDHSLQSRVRQVAAAALHDPPNAPCVSILMATNRPAFLSQALANVTNQNYPRLELILALHGEGFNQPSVQRLLEQVPIDVEVTSVDGKRPFGSVLIAATEASSGALLTKMDDDDVYDAHHVWDLVAAHEYSGAQLVGKGSEFVYLTQSNQTVRRDLPDAESFSRNIAGGTMLISRQDLSRFGGWKRVNRHVDEALIDDVLRGGGRVYRTHGMGYILVRHGNGHTWTVSDAYFRRQAVSVHQGWHPSAAGVADSPRRL